MKSFFFGGLCLFLLTGLHTFGAESASPADAAPAPSDLSAPEAEGDGGSFREQNIYIPYENLRRVFEKPGRGVFLPYDEFQSLWKAAREKPAPPPPGPPADTLFSSLNARATVQGDVVSVQATLRLEVFTKGWHIVPLELPRSALSRAMLDGEPARIRAGTKGRCSLLLRTDGPVPVAHTLDLTFAQAFASSAGRNDVTFTVPRAPVSRWEVVIDEPGVDVSVSPAIALSPAAVSSSAAATEQTRVVAHVGVTRQVSIAWTPKAEGARGLEALTNVATQSRITVDEGVLRVHCELRYAISRAPLRELRVDVPSEYRVVNVYDPNVRKWSTRTEGDRQTLTASLFEPTKGIQPLAIELERFIEPGAIAIPVVRARDALRQRGLLAIRIAEGFRAEAAKRSGLLQLDKMELPPDLRKRQPSWNFAYRYAGLPYALTLDVERVAPRIETRSLAELHLRPETLQANWRAVLDVQRAGVFSIRLRIPQSLRRLDIRGERMGKDVPAVAVDSHHPVEGEPGLVQVNFSRKAKGRVGLRVVAERDLNEPALLKPDGESVAIEVPLPRFDSDTVARRDGGLIVYAPESLRVNADDLTGLRTVSPGQATGGWPNGHIPAGLSPALAFDFGDANAALRVQAERRRPHVTVRQVLKTRIEPGVAQFDARLFYTVRYSGVPAVDIHIPTAIADRIRLFTKGLQHTTLTDEQRGDAPENTVTWRISGDSERSGNFAVRLHWETPVEGMEAGESVDIPIPRLIPAGVDRSWGQVVLTKAEFIDLAPGTSDGVRAIDPRYDLISEASVPDAARAFEFRGDWGLSIRARRFEARDVKATSIERALVRMVRTRGDVTSVQAVYRMKSARQRLRIRLPGDVEFDTRPLRVNGAPGTLEEGDGGEFFVPLAGQNPDAPFLLELRYVLRDTGGKLLGPLFPDEPAVQKMQFSVFYPENWAYLGFRGPWHDEFGWTLDGVTSSPAPKISSGHLKNWVTADTPVSADGLGEFSTDGARVLFSTLRPPVDESSFLRLFFLRRALVNALVLGVGIGIGLLLLPARAPARILVVGVVLVGLLVLDVFCQSLATAMVTNATLSGALVVVVVWTLQYLLVRRPAEQATKNNADDFSDSSAPGDFEEVQEGREGSEASDPGDADEPGQ